jgi:hypothetical protein
VPAIPDPHLSGRRVSWFGDSRGRWDGDALIIEAVNFDGWAKLGTIGHPMSDQATLTMTRTWSTEASATGPPRTGALRKRSPA